MNKEQFKKTIQEKLMISDADFDKAWQEKAEEVALLNLTPEKTEVMTVNRLFVKYSKELHSPAKTYEGIVIAVGNVSDFGAKKLYDKLKVSWNNASEEIKQMYLQTEQFDKEGNPLWCNENTKVTWKYLNRDGTQKVVALRKINPEAEQQRQIIAIAKEEGAPELKLTYLNMYGDKLHVIPSLGVELKFRAMGKFNENNNAYMLNSTVVTQFLAQDIKYDFVSLRNVVEKFLPMFDFCNAQLQDELQKSQNRVVALKNCVAIRVQPTSNNNNVLELSNPQNMNYMLTAWMAKELPCYVSEGDSDLVVLGTLNKGEQITLNVMGILNPNPQPEIKPIVMEDDKTTEGW